MTALSFVWVHPYSQNSGCDIGAQYGQIGTKCGEKTKLARYPKDQKFQEITK